MYFQLGDNQVLSTQGQPDVLNLRRLTARPPVIAVAVVATPVPPPVSRAPPTIGSDRSQHAHLAHVVYRHR